MSRNYLSAFVLISTFTCFIFTEVSAQDTTVSGGIAPAPAIKQVFVEDVPSLFYEGWAHVSLRDAIEARKLFVIKRAEEEARRVEMLTTDEAKAAERVAAREAIPEEELEPIDPGLRILTLSGIVYVASDDWTIWLNERRITPDSMLPEEITSLHVDNGFVEITWLDNYTNYVFPIRLRPHQRFDLDTRIFLPGSN